MDPFTASFTSGYLANIAGPLTVNIIQSVGRRIKKQVAGSEAEGALNRCISAGVVAAVSKAADNASEGEALLADILESFFQDPDTGKELARMLGGEAPNNTELLEIFEDAGYDPETLPGIRFETAIQAFEAAFVAAAADEPLLQSIIQTRQLMTQTHIQRDLLAEMQQLVAFMKQARPGSIGIEANQIRAENVVSGQLIIYQSGETPSSAIQENRERFYLKRLIARCDPIDLGAIEECGAALGASEEMPAIRVSDVFTSLYLKDVSRRSDQSITEALTRSAEAEDLLLELESDVERFPIPAVEAAGALDRLVVLGQPGGGKTTLVNHLAAHLARRRMNDAAIPPLPGWPEGDRSLPVRIVLRHFAAWLPENAKPTERLVWEYLSFLLSEWECAEAYDSLKNVLDEEGGVIFFDGLDEVQETDAARKRTLILSAIREFVKPLSRCRVIVTCREYAYRRGDAWRLPEGEFPVTTLDLFHEDQIREFIQTWYAVTGPRRGWTSDQIHQEADILIQAVGNLPYLRALAPYPLLLTLMTVVHASTGLPRDRADLYERAVNLLLAHWENHIVRDVDGACRVEPSTIMKLGIPIRDLRVPLERLALEAHERQAMESDNAAGCADIPKMNLEYELAQALNRNPEQTREVVEYVQNRSGLLQSQNNRVFTFPHRTFQEYLAATGVMRQSDFPDYLRNRVVEDINWWREVYLLSAGSTRDFPLNIYQLIDALLPEDPKQAKLDANIAKRAGLAAQAMYETGFLAAVRQEKTPGRFTRIRNWVQDWLLAAMTADQILPPKDRCEAGNALNWVGDPRFDPEMWYLPKDNDVGFIEIPAGFFEMGSDKQLKDDLLAELPSIFNNFFYREKFSDANFEDHYEIFESGICSQVPKHRLFLQKYRINKYPVTVSQFRAFLKDSGYIICDEWEVENPKGNHPAVMVSFHDAMEYCEWLAHKFNATRWCFEIRLPSESEWEKAAKGEAGTIYPWGDEWDKNKANLWESGMKETTPVGMYPSGESPYGLIDFAGNVWEWTSTLWGKDITECEFRYPFRNDDKRDDVLAPDDVYRVVRGGGYNSINSSGRTASRHRNKPDFRRGDRGFRVVAVQLDKIKL